LSTLTPSNIFRLQLLSLQFTRPDVLLVDLPLADLSHDDTNLLSAFLKTNSMNSSIVLNLNDEYFIQNIANNIVEVESLDIPTTQAKESLADFKTMKQQKINHVEEATAGELTSLSCDCLFLCLSPCLSVSLSPCLSPCLSVSLSVCCLSQPNPLLQPL
jgi:ATPase subunit of ABC transporter with duplicated ATPase domains